MTTKNTIPWLLALLSALLFASVIYNARAHSASSRYKECARLAASDPAQALSKAKAWRAKDATSPIARHCEALALYGMKDYVNAAKAFEALAADTDKAHIDLSVNLWLQATTARKNAGDAPMATQDLQHVLSLQPNNEAAKSQLTEISGKK